jgi:hypothetical protein
MLLECTVGFRGCNRYMAHSKLDEALIDFPREGQRKWHTSLVQSGDESFSGVIRTKDGDVAKTLRGAKWKEITLPIVGDVCIAYIEVAPKKTTHFGLYRKRDFAQDYVQKRIAECEAFSSFDLEFISSSMIVVPKKGNGYSAPSAWFCVRGKVKSTEALEKLFLQGIGGSHAFGVGLLNPDFSAIFPLAQAVAQAHAD